VTRQREAGFALLIVLWSLVLLALILTQLLSAGRSEVQLASNLRDSAEMEAVADGAIQDAAFHLLAGGAQHWSTRGRHSLHIGRGSAEIGIEDTADKINPNAASPVLLRSLAVLCGAQADAASRLAQAIVAWRDADGATADPAAAYRAAGLNYAPPGLPFETLDELGLVVGMTPALLNCMQPHLSLYQANAPGPNTADALVARALATAALQGDTTAGGQSDGENLGPQTVVITATAALPQGGRFVRRATMRFGDSVRVLTFN
jgi:general secretion pathway protein K